MAKKNKRKPPRATGQTGPKTAAGKARSSQNARKHGLTAKTPPMLVGPDKSAFRAIQKQLTVQYEPEGPLEEFCCVSIAMAMQKQMKIWESEVAAFELASLPKPSNLSTKNIPALPVAAEEERKILNEILQALDDHNQALLGESAYLEAENAKPAHQIAAEKAEAEEEGFEWPFPWVDAVGFAAEDFSDRFEQLHKIYPLDQLPEQYPNFLGSESRVARFRTVDRRLRDLKHPYIALGDLKNYAERLKNEQSESDSSHFGENYFISLAMILREAAEKKLAEINQLEVTNQATIAQNAQIEAQRQQLQQQSIPEQIELITRYQSATSNELEKAIARLMDLQQRRIEKKALQQ